MSPRITFEGYTPDDLLSLESEALDALLISGAPFTFRVGVAVVAGEMRAQEDRLIVELARLEGGGEGLVPALWRVTERLARRRGLSRVDQIMRAPA